MDLKRTLKVVKSANVKVSKVLIRIDGLRRIQEFGRNYNMFSFIFRGETNVFKYFIPTQEKDGFI